MKINAFIPISFKYIKETYSKKGDSIVLQLQEEILPMICERLTSIDLLDSIDMYIDGEFDETIFPPKVRCITRDPLETPNLSYEGVIARYFADADCDIVLGVNPLFPFVRRETYRKLIEDVMSKEFVSSTTAIFGGVGLGDEFENKVRESQHTPGLAAQTNKTDLGVAFCSKVSAFSNEGNRIKSPFSIHPLDTIELISLRRESDARLIELVISSGLQMGL